MTVNAEGQNNITLESQAIVRGLDEQQLRDLPRNSRDIQDFLTLNPNIVGGFDGIQFLGGRTYGASYIQDGQPSSAGIFGELSNAAPGLDAISEVTVLSNSYSAEYGGLAGVIVSTKRGANKFSGSSFYDFNSNELNALTYAQTLTGVIRDDPNADTHDHRFGVSLGGPIVQNRTFFFGNYEGSRLKALGGGAQAVVPTAAMKTGDFSAASFVIRDPVTGQPFPGNRIPADRLDPSAVRILNFFYPAPNQTTTSNGGFGTYRQILPLTRDRDRTDASRRSRADREGLDLRPSELAGPRSGRLHVREHWSERRHRPDQPGTARSSVEGGHRRDRVDARLVQLGRQRIPRRLQPGLARSEEHVHRRRRHVRARHRRFRRWRRRRPASRSSSSPRRTGRRASRTSGRTPSAIFGSLPSR